MSNAFDMLLGGLALIEARDHPSRDGEQCRGGGMPWFEAVMGAWDG